MRRIAVLVIIAGMANVAVAKPKLVSVTQDKTTLSVPEDWTVAVAPRCISLEGAGSMWIIRTKVTQEAFEKAEAKPGTKRAAADKAVCFERSEPGENARCVVTTDAGRWVVQFVAFGKHYSKMGGAEAIAAIVASVKGWDGKPYDGTYPPSGDCRPAG